MRVDVQKLLLFGSASDQAEFFSAAQRFGMAQFIGQPRSAGSQFTVPLDHLKQALKTLHKLPKVEQKAPPVESTCESIVQRTLAAKQQYDELQDELAKLELEEVRLLPLGRFNPEELRWIEVVTRRRIRIFFASQSAVRKTTVPEGLIYITTAYDLQYFMGILHDEVIPAPFVEMEQVRSLRSVYRELGHVRGRMQRVNKELEGYAAFSEFLQQQYLILRDRESLVKAQASSQPMLQGLIFAAFAWVPQNHLEQLHSLCRRHRIASKAIDPEPKERIPTYLENSGVNRLGQDLVELYDTPSINDNDPSGWVLWAFAIFFSMIVNDAGYGLFFLLAGLGVRWRLREAAANSKRLLSMVMLLGSFCIGWGLFAGSFFGIQLKPNNPLSYYSPVSWMVRQKADYHLKAQDGVYSYWLKSYPKVAQAKSGTQLLESAAVVRNGRVENKIRTQFTNDILLELALFVGILHLSCGYLRHMRSNWAGLGWVLVLWGGYLAVPELLKATSMFQVIIGTPLSATASFGRQATAVGLGLAAILAFIQDRRYGELFRSVELLSDLMSYLRLYALGLAGAIVASTANQMGSDVGFFFGFIIIILGHGINIGLAILSGIIHGLRLNFLEWYHTCFEGGGFPFLPLKRLAKHQE